MVQPIQFSARDGYRLSGDFYEPAAPAKGAILVTSGTGFRKSFYKHFAQDAADRGYYVLCFDCRGIGGSAPEDLTTMDDDYTAWGFHDMPAALDYLAEKSGGLPIFHAAHSVGGHFIGLWDNHDKITAHGFICVGSGYWRDHFLSNIFFELFFWWGLGPIQLWRKGYVPKGSGWSGEALPARMFKTWRRWCSTPNYFLSDLDDTNREISKGDFSSVSAPIRSWIYTDDPIANAKTAPVMLSIYPNAQTEILLKSPKDDYGVAHIGHNGPFTKPTKPARAAIIDWFDGFLSK